MEKTGRGRSHQSGVDKELCSFVSSLVQNRRSKTQKAKDQVSHGPVGLPPIGKSTVIKKRVPESKKGLRAGDSPLGLKK